MMTSIKFKYNGDAKKVKFEKKSILFNDLVREAKFLFTTLSSYEDTVISFIWTDAEGDRLRCQTDKEISDAITELKDQRKPLTFTIETAPVSC